MADRTSHEESLPRTNAASRLKQLARQIEGEGPAEVQVGNKVVTLAPGPDVEYAIDVKERSPMLGGHHEAVTVTLEWSAAEEEG